MSRHAQIVMIVLITVALACNAPAQTPVQPTLAGQVLQDSTSTPTPAPAPATQAQVTQQPTQAAPPATNPSLPTTVPGSTGTYFSALITFTDSEEPIPDTRSFALGTEEIFARWRYSGMKPGWTVRREWYLNSELWLEREEAWDFDSHGASGMVYDVSIFDFEAGLPAGQYELRLYVNNQPQFSGDAALRSFAIVPAADLAIPSHDGTLKAYVEGKNKLIVENASGQRVMEIFDEANPNVTRIAGFDWMPQGHYLVYSIMIPAPQGAPPFQTYVLSIVHVDTGTYYEIGADNEYMHHPKVSPDGRYIAVIQGTGYGDACGVGWILGVVEMHTAEVKRVALHHLHQFELPSPGIEANSFSVDAPGLPLPGQWVSNTRLKTGVSWTCVEPGQPTPEGIYELDLNGLTVQKVDDLP